ncbi:MAG TPA: fluoride efflux transporter CrcB [Polyangiaceae bacterium]|nr:fluoride efflux transporter CrcB [Polyangiaceae bacterium]
MSRLVYVFLGGGAGSVARYLTTIAAARLISPDFPFGTMIVNLLGCFLIGFVHSVAVVSARISPDARLFLTTGVLGGFTTYSAFNYDTLSLVEQGQATKAAAYAAAMIVGCAAAGVLGVWSARALLQSV